jgi:hypothetical protein
VREIVRALSSTTNFQLTAERIYYDRLNLAEKFEDRAGMHCAVDLMESQYFCFEFATTEVAAYLRGRILPK